jgi:cysteine peptidase B
VLKLIDARNAAESAKGGTAKHGITKFADFTDAEFKRLLNYKKTAKDALRSKANEAYKNRNLEEVKSTSNKVHAASKPTTVTAAATTGGSSATSTSSSGTTGGSSTSSSTGSPLSSSSSSSTSSTTSVDWTGIYTTSVKDQGYCGSCWAFSATEQIESDSIRAGYLTWTDTLSPQQIVSCDTFDYGCDGGDTITAYEYVAIAGGIVSSTSYPYTSYWGETGRCNIVADDLKLVTVTGFYLLDSNEDAMIDYVKTTGPLSVCLDASTWGTYISGIVTSCGFDVDHCVQAVGLDEDSGYWKLRNSWGTEWGAAGFIYLALNENMCDITYEPTSTLIAKV